MRGNILLETYSVIIADDHILVRDRIKQIVEASPSFHISGEAEDGLSAVALAKAEKPDLIILDIAMPQATGIEVIEEVRRWSPKTKIAVLTGMTGKKLLRHVFEAGADGIFMKSNHTDGWGEDLVKICEGARVIADEVMALIKEDASIQLTRRERQVLFAIVRGENNAKISERLNISVSTVDGHRTKLMRKLGVHSTAELIVRAFRDGLLESENHS